MKDLIKRFDFIDRIEDNSTPSIMVMNMDMGMTRMRVYFKNGRQMSIIRGQFSYGGKDGLFEIMIDGLEGEEEIYDKEDNADIVLGYLSKEKVEYYVHKIGMMSNMTTQNKNRCRKCDIDMVPGQALENTLYGIPDFIGDDYVCTVSMTGPPIMINVWKCPSCGYSTT